MSHSLAGEVVWLLPERALFHPRTATLFVADTHFGKDAVFRAQGIPVPLGSDADTLARLTQALHSTCAQRLVVLGDFLHARESLSASTVDALSRWRERHSTLAAVLVKGNHDLHAGNPPAHLGISVHASDLFEAPFLYTHEPRSDARGYVFGGHVHPGVAIALHGGRVTLPCFFVTPHCATLPSFGAFTGAVSLRPNARAGEKAFAIAGERVLDVTRLARL